MEENRLMFWSCKECGHENDGDKLSCDVCGDHLGYGKAQFYSFSKVDGREGRILEPHEILENPHWNCIACGAMNRDKDRTCHFCFGDRDTYSQIAVHNESDTVKVGKTYDDVLRESDKQFDPNAKSDIMERTGSAISNIKDGISKYSFIFVGLVIAFLLGYGLYWMLSPTEEVLAYIRCDVISERYETHTYNKEGWDTPIGAYDVSSVIKLKGHDKVIDHYDIEYYDVERQVKVGSDCTTKTRKVKYEAQDGYTTMNKGNGQSVKTPRYVTKYKTQEYQDCKDKYVTKTETISKQVPVYRDVPIMKPYYTYKIDMEEVVETMRCSFKDLNYVPCKSGHKWKSAFAYRFIFKSGREIGVNENEYRSNRIGGVYYVNGFNVIVEK